ncbi:MAG: squalene/phytoene synthase family protein [Acidobacteriota bacterium]
MTGIDDLLEKTSRTFALSIPRLPEPTRMEVTVAYLLFRIADTFEDAVFWEPARRIDALGQFCTLLGNPDPSEADLLARVWREPRPLAHQGYLELLDAAPYVLEAFRMLAPTARTVIASHVIRSARGMAEFVGRTEDGTLQLRSLNELRDYCYVVAGIVGEMLCDLFLLDRGALIAVSGPLRERAACFGEGLQLVNILKDSASDRTEGRSYLPTGVSRADVFGLARSDLRAAAEYVLILQREGAPRGIVEFTALPVQLATASLDRIERSGPGAKISRLELFRIVATLEKALNRGEPAVPRGSAGPDESRSMEPLPPRRRR